MSPMQIIQQVKSSQMNNPMMRNAMQMLQGNDLNGLRKMAENLCQSKGINIKDMQNQIMQRFSMR